MLLLSLRLISFIYVISRRFYNNTLYTKRTTTSIAVAMSAAFTNHSIHGSFQSLFNSYPVRIAFFSVSRSISEWGGLMFGLPASLLSCSVLIYIVVDIPAVQCKSPMWHFGFFVGWRRQGLKSLSITVKLWLLDRIQKLNYRVTRESIGLRVHWLGVRNTLIYGNQVLRLLVVSQIPLTRSGCLSGQQYNAIIIILLERSTINREFFFYDQETLVAAAHWHSYACAISIISILWSQREGDRKTRPASHWWITCFGLLYYILDSLWEERWITTAVWAQCPTWMCGGIADWPL